LDECGLVVAALGDIGVLDLLHLLDDSHRLSVWTDVLNHLLLLLLLLLPQNLNRLLAWHILVGSLNLNGYLPSPHLRPTQILLPL
jgi:hypothetical protein